MTQRRLHTVDALRTAAAFSVALYHYLLFDAGAPLFPSLHADAAFFEILRTVVLTFFIVTGIVIPLHSDTQGYEIRQYPVFFLKRLIRVHIPFMAVIACMVVYEWLVYAYNGSKPHFDWQQLQANLTYTAEFQHRPWYNTIFWTLAIEMQFYVIAGLVYPFIRKWGVKAIGLYFLAGELLWLSIPDTRFVWAFTPYFTLGFLIYEMYRGGLSRTAALLSALAMTLVTGFLHDAYAAPVTLLVPCACILLKDRTTFLSRLGKYTFSYYLFHGFAGGTLLYLMRYTGGGTVYGILKLVLAFAVSFLASYIFYLLFEKPATRLTHRIPYRKR
jgi:peptidoglycan/LPS O-acetylase OafA/YrhL